VRPNARYALAVGPLVLGLLAGPAVAAEPSRGETTARLDCAGLATSAGAKAVSAPTGRCAKPSRSDKAGAARGKLLWVKAAYSADGLTVTSRFKFVDPGYHDVWIFIDAKPHVYGPELRYSNGLKPPMRAIRNKRSADSWKPFGEKTGFSCRGAGTRNKKHPHHVVQQTTVIPRSCLNPKNRSHPPTRIRVAAEYPYLPCEDTLVFAPGLKSLMPWMAVGETSSTHDHAYVPAQPRRSCK
jgi:hypothetical protein